MGQLPYAAIVSAALFTAASVQATIYTVKNANSSGRDSLYQAMTDANGSSGNVIQFALHGNGVQTIALTSLLPRMTTAVTIDGYSQGGIGYTGSPLIEISGSL